MLPQISTNLMLSIDHKTKTIEFEKNFAYIYFLET